MKLLSASQTVLGTLIDWWATMDPPSSVDSGVLRIVVDPAFHPASDEPMQELLDEVIPVVLPRSAATIPKYRYDPGLSAKPRSVDRPC